MADHNCLPDWYNNNKRLEDGYDDGVHATKVYLEGRKNVQRQ